MPQSAEDPCLPTEPFWEAIASELIEERLELTAWGDSDPAPGPGDIPVGDCVWVPWQVG
jgi:hypothetical protein